jgi:outer membrane autotransporter protein
MKTLFLGAAIALLAGATGVSAQETGDAFGGFKIGGGLDYRRNEARRPVTGLANRIDKQEGGTGFRVHAGYDAPLGDRWLVGVEGAVGGGGKTLQSKASDGEYRLKPGLSYDASARLGVKASDTVLLYGRAGYQWLKTSETVSFTAPALARVSHKKTEGGVMYGFGAEFAVAEGFTVRTEFDQTDFGHGLKQAQVQLGGAVRF